MHIYTNTVGVVDDVVWQVDPASGLRHLVLNGFPLLLDMLTINDSQLRPSPGISLNCSITGPYRVYIKGLPSLGHPESRAALYEVC